MKRIISIGIVVFFLVALFIWAVIGNNPYSPFSRIQSPYIAKVNTDGQMVLQTRYTPHLRTDIFSTTFAFVQSGVRIVVNTFLSERPFSGSETQIISQIHTERFDPSKIYLISGGHFSDMYPRNLGIFYNALLDPCIPSSQVDWENREKIALQTTAFDLSLLSQAKEEPTTFMPIWGQVFVPVNIYTRPSDSLYGILYTLNAMQEDTFGEKYTESTHCHKMQTEAAAEKLLSQYRSTLSRLVKQYKESILDPKTLLVKKNIHLSSARDGIWRESSFYDNVIAWATLTLAKEEGVYDGSIDFTTWKKKIISSFWDERSGIFLDDLSSFSKNQHSFSADSLIVIQTGFLDPAQKEDKEKISSMVAYTSYNKLDTPLPLAYSTQNRPERTYPFVNIAAPSYMGKSIWSHWGMEYLKAQLLLGEDVKPFLAEYKKRIEKYGGYPELYNTNGTLFSSLFYKSVLHTGWVINYEEVKALVASHTQ